MYTNIDVKKRVMKYLAFWRNFWREIWIIFPINFTFNVRSNTKVYEYKEKSENKLIETGAFSDKQAMI